MSRLVTDKQENDHQHWRLRGCLQSVAHFLNHAPRCGFISNSLFSKCLDFSAAARSSGNLTKSFIRISKLIKTYLHLAFMIWWSCCCLMFALIGEWWLSEPENRQALRMKISDCVSDSRSRAQNKERRGEERSDPGSECGPEYPVRPGYYQRGITIFARQNKIQGIMSRALFNWQSLTLSLSECQKLHLSSHNKWRDQGGVERGIFFSNILYARS